MSSCSQTKSENGDSAGSKSLETPATLSAQSDEEKKTVATASPDKLPPPQSQNLDGNYKNTDKADDDENDNAGGDEVALVNVPEHKKKASGKKQGGLTLSSGSNSVDEEAFTRSPPRKKLSTGFSALKKKMKSRFKHKRSSSARSINSDGALNISTCREDFRMKKRNSSALESHLRCLDDSSVEQKPIVNSVSSEPYDYSSVVSSPMSATSAPENFAAAKTFLLNAVGSLNSTNSEASQKPPAVSSSQNNDTSAQSNQPVSQQSVPDVEEKFRVWAKGTSEEANDESPATPSSHHNDPATSSNIEVGNKSVSDVNDAFRLWVKGSSDTTKSEASPDTPSSQHNDTSTLSNTKVGGESVLDATTHAAGGKVEPTEGNAICGETIKSNELGQEKENEGTVENVSSGEQPRSKTGPPPKIRFNQMVQRVISENLLDEEDMSKSFIIRNRDDAKKAAVLERLGVSVRFSSKSDDIDKIEDDDKTSEGDVRTNESDSKADGGVEGDSLSEDESSTTPNGTSDTPKAKFNEMVKCVIATTSSEPDDDTDAKDVIIRTRDDARKAAVLQRLSTSFRFKSARNLGGTDDEFGLDGPKTTRRRFTSLIEKHKSLERSTSIESQSPSITAKKPNEPMRRAPPLRRSASTALLSCRSTIDSFEDADYAGFTGLRKLCNAVMLDGRHDLQWDRVREYLKRLDPDEARIAAEKREGEEEETALHLVCRQRPPPDVVQLLLQASRAPASWKLKSSGWTPLHLECRGGGNELVVRLLLKAHKEGASDIDKHGRTPLHLATGKSVKIPPTFATLKRLMTKTALNTRSLSVKEDQRKSVFRSIKAKQIKAAECYPLELDYLADQAEHIASESISELNYAKECLEMFLDSKIEKLNECTHREASLLISTLEGSPDWFQEQAGVHPYVQAILNWKIGQRFVTAVMLLDFYVLIMLISAFRIAAHDSLVERYDLFEGEKPVDDVRGFDGGSGRSYLFWFWTRSDQSPALGIYTAPDDDDDTLDLVGPILALYIGVFYLLMREIFQMISLARRGLFSSWLFDVWNYLDVSCFSLVWLTTYSMHRGVGNDEDVKLKVVLTTGILWMMMLSFLKLTRRDFAVFVSGVIHVTVTLRSFLVTLGIFLAAFAQMYYTSFMGTERCLTDGTTNTPGSSSDVDYDFCTAYGPYLKVYMMLLGGGVDESDFTYDNVSLYLSIWFSFTVVIILLNVLIAIVTDSYQDVKSHGEAVFWNHRLSFIFEVDQIHDMCEDFFCWIFSVDDDDESVENPKSSKIIDGWGGIVSMRVLSRRLSRGVSNSALSIMSTDSFTDYSTDDETLGTLWDICLIAFEDPTETSVWRRKCNLNEKWTGPKWVLGNMENPLIYPDKVAPSMVLRLLYAFFIPLWVVAGLVTAGVLWPQQIRKWCFCSHLTAEEKGHKLASNEDIRTINDHAKEEVRDEIRRVEGTMEEKFETVKGQIDDMKESIDDVKKSLGSLKEVLNALLEIEERRTWREGEVKDQVNDNKDRDPLRDRERKENGKKVRVRFDE